MRRVGDLGGRARARNLRLRKAREVPVIHDVSRPREETAGEASRRIDALCPWLVGAERGDARRRTSRQTYRYAWSLPGMMDPLGCSSKVA
jgi:hypothetical protein